MSSSPAVDIDRERVIVGSDDGVIYALRVTDGVPKWTRPIGPINMSSPAISNDGLIYIGSLDNQTYCLNATAGDVVWMYETGGPIVSSPALTDEHVMISSNSTESVHCIGPPFPLHDVAVSNVTVFPTTVLHGESVNITYTVVNNGNVDETFEATCLCNNTLIWEAPLYNEPVLLHTENITLSPGENVTKTYTWNTTDVSSSNYTVMVQANLPIDIRTDETILANNTYIDGKVYIKSRGDANDDRTIDIFDIGYISAHWYPGPPIGPLGYDANADVNDDGAVDTSDIGIVSAHWGESSLS